MTALNLTVSDHTLTIGGWPVSLRVWRGLLSGICCHVTFSVDTGYNGLYLLLSHRMLTIKMSPNSP